ncbi:hypothetical protein FJU58_16640 [Acinetobacter baumannii]|uniref:hypothetical protein n=1 Tax=Acinetobacter baumannii TaxID=470 RepID=UPI00112B7C13|nr:hypothetical protein [Acinetobacter baumannii]TPT71631.1 hypothetical protein FJU58_16640 [Acinetobacter baumannii]
MSSFSIFLISRLSSIVKVSTDIFKISLFFGVVLSIYHFYKIDYLPKDLTIGDGFLFMLISSKFAFIGSIFIGSLLVVGFLIFKLFKIIYLFYKERSFVIVIFIYGLLIFLSRENLDGKIMMTLGTIIFVPLSILVGIVFWGRDWISLCLFLATSFITYIFFDIFKRTKNHSNLLGDEKYTQMSMALIFILGFPVYFYSIFTENKKLTDFSLNSLQENDKNAIFFVKKEHKDLFPKNNVIEQGEYIILKNAKVILRGFGRNALIEYNPVNDKNEVSSISDKVEVPNEDLQIKWVVSQKNNKI